MLIKSESKIEQVNFESSGIWDFFTTKYTPEFYVNGFNHHVILATGLFKTVNDEYFKFEIRNTCDFSGLTREQIIIEHNKIKHIEQTILESFGFQPPVDPM